MEVEGRWLGVKGRAVEGGERGGQVVVLNDGR